MKVQAAWDWSENAWGSFYENQPRNIIIPPYGGEFGWFCSHWVRQVDQLKADSLVVLCREDEKIFYPNATEFYHDFDADCFPPLPQGMGKKPVWWHQGQILEKVLEDNPKWKDYIIFRPSKGWEYSMDLNHQVKMTPLVDVQVDLVISARHIEYEDAYVSSKKAKTNINVDTLPLKELKDLGIKIGLIGLPSETLDLEDVDVKSYDFPERNDAAVSMLQNCKLALLQNSGPMHLSSLCNAPTVVFGIDKVHMVNWAARQRSPYSFFRYHGGKLNSKDAIFNYVKDYFDALPEKTMTNSGADYYKFDTV